MKRTFLKLTFVFFLGFCLSPVLGQAAQEGKIDAFLQSELAMASPGEKIPVIVRMKDPVAIQPLAAAARKKGPARTLARANMIHALKARDEQARQPLQKLLDRHGITKARKLWLINGTALQATPAQIEEMSSLPEVASIVLDQAIQLPKVVPTQAAGSVEPNIDQVNAPDLWALGYTGQGVTVAVVDSGVDSSHPDLGPRYRGGSNSWYDPNGEHLAPADVTGHGTQVTGLVLGGNNSGAYIGVAPHAQWIAVKIFDDNDIALLSVVHDGFQWLLDPDKDPLTDDAPDIVNNSWGFEFEPNICDDTFSRLLQPDVQLMKAAGIAVLFAAGNTGPNPSTSIAPANYEESFAVGSVDTSSLISPDSARGPSACDGTIYPEVVAPGVHILTSDLTTIGTAPNPDPYSVVFGTSFSVPHASGMMALLLSAFPSTPVSGLEAALTLSATDLGALGADNTYGYGLINAQAAFNSLGGAGTAVPVPDITVTDSVAPNNDLLIPFGSVTAGGGSDQTITVANSGNADLVLGAIASANPLVAPFILQELDDNCSGQTLSPAGSCTFVVSFSPVVAGVFTESFDIPSNDLGEMSVVVDVTGEGTPAPVADITVTDSVDPADDLRVPFGNLTEGLLADQTVTVANAGSSNLVIGNIAIANPIAAPFSIIRDTCTGRTLAAATGCTFDVRFAPFGAGTFSDSFDIPSNDPDENTVRVDVTGTGLPAVTNNPPDKPTLVYPANGQLQLPTTLTFEWQTATDPDGDPVSYDIFFCADADPFNNCNAVQITTLGGQGIGGQPNGTIYYAGISSGAVIMFFGVAFAGRFRGRKKIGLLLVVAIAIGMLLVACHPDGQDSSGTSAANQTYTVSSLSSATKYYWGVVAKDGQGGQTQSSIWNFTTL